MPIPIGRMELGRELASTLRELNHLADTVERDAKRMGTEPHLIRDTQGNLVLAPIISSKAQCLHALVLLNQKGN